MRYQISSVRVYQRLTGILALAACVFAASVFQTSKTAIAAGAAPHSQSGQDATAQINDLIAKYAAVINGEHVDLALAARVWSNAADVSLIFPAGEMTGWEQIKQNFYQNIFEVMLSDRKLTPRDSKIHAYGDSAWAEFSWNFVAKMKKDGSKVETNGRETQIYRRAGPDRWVLVHVHYSALPPATPAPSN